MPKLPRVTAIETIKALEKLGFAKVRQKGSHVMSEKAIEGSRKCSDRLCRATSP